MAQREVTAEAQWESLVNRKAAGHLTKVERAALNLGEQNADDTSVERKFELFSSEWYEVFARSYEFSLDTADDEMIESWGF